MSCHQKKKKSRSENQNESIFIPYYVILTEGSVVSPPHGQQSYKTTLRIFEKLWAAQRPPNISKVDYYHFFFFLENTSVQGTGKDSMQHCVSMGYCGTRGC